MSCSLCACGNFRFRTGKDHAQFAPPGESDTVNGLFTVTYDSDHFATSASNREVLPHFVSWAPEYAPAAALHFANVKNS
jgi:hypothetical protein